MNETRDAYFCVYVYRHLCRDCIHPRATKGRKGEFAPGCDSRQRTVPKKSEGVAQNPVMNKFSLQFSGRSRFRRKGNTTRLCIRASVPSSPSSEVVLDEAIIVDVVSQISQ